MLTKWEKQYIESHIGQIDELIADADPLFLDGVISEEYGKDHYDKWKNHERKEIRAALAQHGYYPEVFINDKEPYIRELVVQVYPEYCGQLLTHNKKAHWKFVCERIDETTDLNYIKTFLDAPIPNNIDETKLQAIRTMYAARTSAPNTIEKTMSPRQLFQSQSPFWAKGLTVRRIQTILNLYSTIEQTGVIENFDKLVTATPEQFVHLVRNLHITYRKET